MKPIRIKPKKTTVPLKTKKPGRHWLLTSFIYLLIFLNGMVVFLGLLAITYISQQKGAINPALHAPGIYSTSLFIAILNIFCLNQLLKMQLWGFWGYCFGALATLVLLTVIDHSPDKILINALICFGNPIVLFGLLFLGGKNSAWNQMSKM